MRFKKGSYKHFMECLMIYGSVINSWNNKKQRLEYFIPATCLTGMKELKYYIPKDLTSKAYSVLKDAKV